MIVITGGAGFIGSAFLWKLNCEGIDDVIVVDNLGTSDKWKNLVKRRYVDYLHKDNFLEIVREDKMPFRVDAIIHMGACSSTTERNADYLMENNYHYTRMCAQWAIQRGIRFIYASSAATYGDGSNGFSDADEVSVILRPINMYGYSKQVFDLWVLRNHLQDKIVGVKFFNVFGPNEYHKGEMKSLANKAFYQIKETGKIDLFKSYRPEFGDGAQLRDFVYVKDCVEVLWWLLENPDVNGIFNVGTGLSRSWNDLACAVFSAMKKEHRISYIEMPEAIRDQYQYFTEAKMDKLRAAGCPVTFGSLEDSVYDYIVNYLEKDDLYL